MRVKDLKKDERNPRKITSDSAQILRKTLAEFGSLDGIVWNASLKKLLGGHQRSDVLPPDSEIVIEKRFQPPTKTGTVATGYVLMPNGERIPYREVDFDQQRHTAAMIAANNSAGDWDRPKLAEVVLELDAVNYDLELTGMTAVEIENLVAPTGLPPKKKRVEFDASEKTEGQGTNRTECPRCGYQI